MKTSTYRQYKDTINQIIGPFGMRSSLFLYDDYAMLTIGHYYTTFTRRYSINIDPLNMKAITKQSIVAVRHILNG